MTHPHKILRQARLVVVKLGTGMLSRKAGGLDPGQIQRLSRQIALLRRQKCRVVIVSSGAISAGMSRLNLRQRPSHIADLQACAAVGQNLLMACYERAFARWGITVAQILLTHGDLQHRERRKNARHTILNLLQRNVVPIINENDAVSFAEIKFGDNDQLAAMVHELIHADACIILSNVDGFMVRQTWKHPTSNVQRLSRLGGDRASNILPKISKITAAIERQAGDSDSHQSVGGMRSKLIAARRVLATGRPMVIANGRVPNVLPRLLKGEPIGTIFLP